MTPEEAQRLQVCVQEIAAILHRNTPAEELKTLEGIEKAVRQQMLEYVTLGVTNLSKAFTAILFNFLTRNFGYC